MRKVHYTTVIVTLLLLIGSMAFATGTGEQSTADENVELYVLTPFDANILGAEYVDNLQIAADELGYDATIENVDDETYKTKIRVALAGNDLPDVFFTWGDSYTVPFLEAGALYPLTDALAESGLDYMPGYTNPWSDGEVYTAPYTPNDHYVVLYNKAIFEQAGIEGEPETWDEMLAAIEAIKSEVPEVFPMIIAMKFRWQGDLLYNQLVLREDPQAFQQALDGDIAFTAAPFVRAAERLSQLIQVEPYQRGYMQMTQPEIHEIFWAGQAAMYSIGTWAFAPSIDELGDDLGYFAFPQTVSDPDYRSKNTSLFGELPNGLVVSGSSESPDAAARYAFRYSKLVNDAIVANGRVPFIETDVTPNDPRHPAYQEYVDESASLEVIQPWWYSVIDPSIGEPMRDLVQEYFFLEMTPQEFTAELESLLSEARE
jgi:raffinose/stachyose/melibiose transport system substrate-binding protein